VGFIEGDSRRSNQPVAGARGRLRRVRMVDAFVASLDMADVGFNRAIAFDEVAARIRAW